MMRKLLSTLVFVALLGSVYGQGDPHYSMYMFNKLMINPAYAGSHDALNITGHYRNQWQGIAGAPKTYTLAAHTPLFKNKVGVGASILVDQIGIMSVTYADLYYTYRIPINDKTRLAIGVQGQLDYGRIDWSSVDALDAGDQRVGNDIETRVNPNFGFGAYLQHDAYYVGVSVPRILKTSIYEKEHNTDLVNINSLRSYYFMGGFVKRLNDNVKLQPSVLVSYNPNAPFELALNTNFVFMDALWLGASYRLGDSFDFIAKYQITPQLRLAAAVDVTLTELTNYSPGSFEVMAEYLFLKKAGRYNNLRYF